MTSVVVEVTTKVIRASWTKEMASDIKSFHGMDYDKIENELRRESRKRKIEKILNS